MDDKPKWGRRVILIALVVVPLAVHVYVLSQNPSSRAVAINLACLVSVTLPVLATQLCTFRPRANQYTDERAFQWSRGRWGAIAIVAIAAALLYTFFATGQLVPRSLAINAVRAVCAIFAVVFAVRVFFRMRFIYDEGWFEGKARFRELLPLAPIWTRNAWAGIALVVLAGSIVAAVALTDEPSPAAIATNVVCMLTLCSAGFGGYLFIGFLFDYARKAVSYGSFVSVASFLHYEFRPSVPLLFLYSVQMSAGIYAWRGELDWSILYVAWFLPSGVLVILAALIAAEAQLRRGS